MGTKTAEKQLNRLLGRNYDAEKGYQEVADKADDGQMTSFFKNNASERNRFGHEIKKMITEAGGKPDKGTTTEADVHRAWINVKETLSLNSDKAILEEAERGEEYAIDDYQEAIENENLTPEQKRKLSDHLKSIKGSKEQINKMKATVKS